VITPAVSAVLAAPAVHAAPAVLASESDKSGPLGLAALLVLGIACYFLFKSMSKHMR
jgi:hypothetical protein